MHVRTLLTVDMYVQHTSYERVVVIFFLIVLCSARLRTYVPLITKTISHSLLTQAAEPHPRGPELQVPLSYRARWHTVLLSVPRRSPARSQKQTRLLFPAQERRCLWYSSKGIE